jgi:Na+-translocating ferredoxin:NAD+ oxidoreductase subunit G
MLASVQKNSKILALFAIVCTAIMGLVNELTKHTIARQQQQQLLNQLYSIIDQNNVDNDIYQDCVLISDPALGGAEPQTAYLARFQGQPVAAALTSIAPDGYSGNIELLIAINIDGSISGVRALKHQETPGLGDKIESRKSTWINGFAGKMVHGEKDSQFAVAKDGGMFDQFTGATITPRAVVKAVKRTALYFQQHKQDIFASKASCRSES